MALMQTDGYLNFGVTVNVEEQSHILLVNEC